MNPIYTAESLNGKLISELKAIARTIGATVEGDLRKKATWVEAIVAHQVARIESVASNLVEELVGEIDSVADAAQAAVYERNSEAHARLEEQLLDLQVLMADIQTQLSLDISAIRTTIAEIDHVLPPAQIWWHDRILNSPIQENDNEIWDGNDFIGYSEDKPPGRGGGRIETEIWNEF